MNDPTACFLFSYEYINLCLIRWKVGANKRKVMVLNGEEGLDSEVYRDRIRFRIEIFGI